MLAAGDALPASVRDATLARVARLGPEAKGLVDVAAVVGQRVPPDLLDELAPGYEAAVEEALARGVLTDDGTTFGFRHELTRQAIEQALAAPPACCSARCRRQDPGGAGRLRSRPDRAPRGGCGPRRACRPPCVACCWRG